MSLTTFKPFSALFRIFVASLCFLILFASCERDDESRGDYIPAPGEVCDQVLFVYFPWSGLNRYLEDNLKDIEKSMLKMNLNGRRCLVYMHSAKKTATMFEIKVRNGKCVRDTLKNYRNQSCITAEGISNVLFDLQEVAPSNRYGMAVGAHGTGWLPVVANQQPYFLKQHKVWENTGDLLFTRGFGDAGSYGTNTVTFAKAIQDASMHFDYILFDVCYMSNVEVAYDLKNVTDYLIASTSEIMAYGMPYHLITRYLLGEHDYQAICQKFYEFYSTYKTAYGEDASYGTIAVTKTSELDSLAHIMREINLRYEFAPSSLKSLQFLDGYQPHIFYDLGNYVRHLSSEDVALLECFNEQLLMTVPYKACTKKFYSMLTGSDYPISEFCGLTISDPSINKNVEFSKSETLWYAATH